MTIHNVFIQNHDGEGFWDRCMSIPNEESIHADIVMALSYNEYQQLLKQDRSGRCPDTQGMNESLISERDNLEVRRQAVQDRINDKDWWAQASLPEQNLMRREFNVLTEYSDILRERIGPDNIPGRDVASVGVPEPVETKQLDDEPASRTVPIAQKEGLPVKVVDQQNPAAGTPAPTTAPVTPQKTAPAKKASTVKAVHPPARVVSKKKA